MASVVMVSDYAGDRAMELAGTRQVMEALRRDGRGDGAEVLLMEPASCRLWPEDWEREFPGLRIVACECAGSYALKNAGVKAAASDVVAVLDADCIPGPGWLHSLVEALKRHPECGAVSGRTVYSGKDLVTRSMALAGRSYLDPGKPDVTSYISNNNAAYRREVYLRYPLREDAGPFTANLQSEEMSRAGLQFYFEPAATVVHHYEGWRMEADIRRHSGYASLSTRMIDRGLPFARLAGLGLLAVPLFAGGKLIHRAGDCLRCHEAYGLRPWETPFALALACVVQGMELPGMIRAAMGWPVGPTAFR